jgi:hypothetical protein
MDYRIRSIFMSTTEYLDYNELTPLDAGELAIKHLVRGQVIPHKLMEVLEENGIAEYFKEVPEE